MVRPQGNLVAREQLMRKLDEIPRRKLTLVSAPAGFGKTTAISSWIEAQSLPVAWLSLDSIDNDPPRFFTYFIAALRTIHPEIGAGIAAELESARAPVIEQLLALLINELAAVREDFLLVLDDYHMIENEELQEALLFILERAPASLHLVITTRVDPPIPLARFRVRGELLEIRAADLRFTSQDVLTFFNERMRLDLSEEHLRALQQKTEGWVAGLQLAALSLQGREDVEGFIAAFTGADRYVLDYLLEEVLALLPPDLQRVMPELAVLERFNGELCEVLTGCDSGSELLIELERRNLFVISLDNRREWYRYHHLFGDLLLHRLRQQDGAKVAELHRRASLWYTEQGMSVEATAHACEVGDPHLLGGIMERFWRHALNNFGSDEFTSTMAKIPREVITPSLYLRLLELWAYLYKERIEDAEPLIGELEAMVETKLDDPGMRELMGHVWFMRAAIARDAVDIEQTVECGERALQYLPDFPVGSPNYMWNTSPGMTYLLMASTMSLDGDSERVVPMFEQALQYGRAHNDSFTQSAALSNLCRKYALTGALTAAEKGAQELQDLVGRSTIHLVNVRAVPYQVFGRVSYERGEVDRARQMMQCAMKHSGPKNYAQWSELCRMLYQIEITAGDYAAARGAIDEIESTPAPEHAGRFALIAPMLRADLACRMGDLPPALQWAESIIDSSNHSIKRTFILKALEETVLLQILHRAGRIDEATARLDVFMKDLEERAHVPNLIECHLIRAQILVDRNGEEAALENVLQALKYGAQEGIAGAFMRGGTPIARLIATIMKRDLWETAAIPPHYMQRIAEACGVAGGVAPVVAPTVTSTATAGRSTHDLQPLTSREKEILQLMAMGYSNQKIADKLYVSINTIKTHIANLFDKLGVRSRVEALLRARESNLL